MKRGKAIFGSTELMLPKPDYPISRLENFRRVAARNNPLWVPNTISDVQTLITRGPLFGEQSGVVKMSELPDGGRYIDWYGVDWTWVASAGGPMVTPGTQLLDDITKWETDIKFPDLKSFDWTEQAKNFMENTYNPDKVMNVNIGAGCTERLVAVLGGYSESMLAMAMEPEAVIDFCNYFADFTIRFLDVIFGFFPVNMVTMHDDWGTERDTFFSSAMMEEMILEPTNRIVQHVKNKGSLFELHSCGNITRFIPYMIDMNIDFMQIQRRAVDIPAAKAKYGDRIGFDTGIEGIVHGEPVPPPRDEFIQKIRNTVDLYGKGGGFITNIFPFENPKDTWDAYFELYCYSREFYDRERGE